MPFTMPSLHARTRDQGVCPSAGHAVHHLQLQLQLQLPMALLGPLAGHRRVA